MKSWNNSWVQRVRLYNAVLAASRENSGDLSAAVVCRELQNVCHDIEGAAAQSEMNAIADRLKERDCPADAVASTGQSTKSSGQV